VHGGQASHAKAFCCVAHEGLRVVDVLDDFEQQQHVEALAGAGTGRAPEAARTCANTWPSRSLSTTCSGRIGPLRCHQVAARHCDSFSQWCMRASRGLQASQPVRFADVNDAARPLPVGTTHEQLLARFHVRDANGRLLSGAQALLA
jgi:hypothetical protein